jgi:hypothetical protein
VDTAGANIGTHWPMGAERCAVTHMMAPVTRYKRDRVASIKSSDRSMWSMRGVSFAAM